MYSKYGGFKYRALEGIAGAVEGLGAQRPGMLPAAAQWMVFKGLPCGYDESLGNSGKHQSTSSVASAKLEVSKDSSMPQKTV